MSEQATQVPPKLPPTNVVQYHPDGLGFFVEPGQVAITLATRFHPYNDGTVEEAARPVCVIRLPTQAALHMITQLSVQIKKVDELLRAQVAEAELKKMTDKALADAQAAAQGQKDEAPVAE